MSKIYLCFRSALLFLLCYFFILASNAEVIQVNQNQAFPNSPVLTPFFDKYWMLVDDFTYNITNSNEKIVVPAGFVTDLASIPDVISKTGRYSSAGILHDYLYWEKSCSQKQADRILKQALLDTGVSKATATSIKAGVKAANKTGNIPWKNNFKKRKKFYPRVIPKEYRNYPVGIKWKDYQKYLISKGVKSKPIVNKEANYCKYFNEK